VKGPVPPLVVAVAVPFAPPLHVTSVEAEMAATGPATFETETAASVVHPCASVMVTEYAPAARLLAFAALPPDGDHW